MKFNAVHSSSALCVNNFAVLKQHVLNLTFQKQYSNFIDCTFEKKLPTGISTPNLDFYLESDSTIIGFESKFTEHFSSKLPNKDGNLNKYLDRKELNYLPDTFKTVIDKYIQITDKLNLDVAQLIKHSIGLIKRNVIRDKVILDRNLNVSKPVLVYIYWEPTNYLDYSNLIKHRTEIDEFCKDINEYIEFIPMTYSELWKSYENDELYRDHFKKIKKRYSFSI